MEAWVEVEVFPMAALLLNVDREINIRDKVSKELLETTSICESPFLPYFFSSLF